MNVNKVPANPHHNLVKEAIEERIRNLNKMLDSLGKADNDKGKMRVRIATKGDRYEYYLVERGKMSHERYVRRNNIHEVIDIIQNEYERKAKDELIEEIKYLTRITNEYNGEKIADLYSNLHPGRKALITPIDMSEEDYAKYWQEVTYEAKPLGEGRTFSETLKGEKVRSKSEALIADTLMARGIPYHYEKPLILNNNLKIHPDFTVLNVRKKKTIYLEHLGMVDERGYLTDAIDRLEQYEKNGIILGDNLLVTYETERRPLKRSMVESLIKNYLI